MGIVLLGVCGASLGQEIAFSAGLTHHQAVNGGQKVKYDRVFTNVGHAYEPTTGVFTCPTSGPYVFQVHSLSRNNSHYVLSIWGHTDNDSSAAGNSAILQLTK